MSQGVTRTANEALTCKASALNDGDFSGPRKTPLLNRVYRTRGMLMHKLLATTIASFAQQKGSPQLLVLGGGLDMSYDSYGTQVFVVDFEDVIARRNGLYASALASNLHLIAGDLRHADPLVASLVHAGLETNLPTVILVECVLAYVDIESSQRLLQKLSSTLRNCVIIMYDPVLPYGNPVIDGFAQLMYDKFAERGAPLLSCARTVQEYGNKLSLTGWPHVIAVSVNQAQQLFLSKEERTKTRITEPFDEFASLAMLQNYYGVCIASNNSTIFSDVLQTLYNTSSSGTETAQERLDRLEIRAALAEMRLTQLESRKVQQPRSSSSSRLDIAIRPATLQDTNTLVQVYQEALLEPSQKYKSVLKYVKMSSKALKQIDKTYPPEQGSVLFVAEAPGTSAAGAGQPAALLGCIGVKVKLKGGGADEVPELSHFCVAPSSQGQGVGKALLNKALNYCKEKLGSNASVCLTVLKDLEAARCLYSAAGFELVRIEKLGADCELCYMRKNIQ